MTTCSNRAIRAVLFDLDDTLYDRGALFARWSEGYVHDVLGIVDPSCRRALLDRIGAYNPDGYGSNMMAIEELCRITAEAEGCELADMQSEVARLYDNFVERLALDQAAEELLASLERLGIPYGIVTNGTDRQWRKLEQLGLIERAGCHYVSDTFGSSKPEAAIFKAAAQHLGASPGEVLFVGDNPIDDIVGAHRAGMKTAWLHRDKPWPDDRSHPTPDYTIDTIAQVLNLVSVPVPA